MYLPSCRRMVKVKKKIFVWCKTSVVHQGRTSHSEDTGGCSSARAISAALQAVDEQPHEPGPVPAKVRKQQEVQAWIEIRSSLPVPAVESHCPSLNPCGYFCHCVLAQSETWRCRDCYCQATMYNWEVHSKFNMLHEIELWDLVIY